MAVNSCVTTVCATLSVKATCGRLTVNESLEPVFMCGQGLEPDLKRGNPLVHARKRTHQEQGPAKNGRSEFEELIAHDRDWP